MRLLSKFPVLVKNSTGTTEDPPKGYNSWLEWYFNGQIIYSSMRCPSCGLLMINPGKKRQNPKGLPYMVGGHVESVYFPSCRYITPICNECNDKKEKLPAFKVKFGYLRRLIQ